MIRITKTVVNGIAYFLFYATLFIIGAICFISYKSFMLKLEVIIIEIIVLVVGVYAWDYIVNKRFFDVLIEKKDQKNK